MSHIPRILVDLPLITGERLALPQDKSHHLITVLRLREGTRLCLFNGDGNEYAATITSISRSAVEVGIESVSKPQRESPLRITLAQGIARADRMDFAIAKAVELGVDAIQPLFTERGKIKLQGTRLQKKQTHWQRVADSAAEQSGRLNQPRIQPACTLTQFLDHTSEGLRLVLAPKTSTHLGQLEYSNPLTLLIGPESGLSSSEVETACDAGFTALCLGPRILRTETAGMAALAAIQGRWGDLG